MKKRHTAPWKKSAPRRARRTKLTPQNKAKAKTAARRAGRRYPSLVDNMNAARKQRRASGSASRSRKPRS